MFELHTMNADRLDFFRELENIGAGNAATALSTLLDRPVDLKIPRAQLLGYNEICDILKGPESVVCGLLVAISEDISGYILLVLGEEDAQRLSHSVLGEMMEGMEGPDLEEMETSALKEVANILIGSYITAISDMTGLKIDASVPELVFDMAGAVMNLLAVAYGELGEHVLFMETEFSDADASFFGHFFLIPDIPSCKTLTEKFGL